MNANECYELGKMMFFSCEDEKTRERGVEIILKAYQMGSDDAAMLVADFLLQKVVIPKAGDPTENALEILCKLANKGNVQAKCALNDYCYERYKNNENYIGQVHKNQPLRDFDGKVIKINRKGLLTPVDAVLEFTDGRNVLNLSANVNIYMLDDMQNGDLFKDAVLEGFNSWAGTYTVFGGQQLDVKINLTTEDKIIDSIIVFPVTEELESEAIKFTESVGDIGKKASETFKSKRTFITGFRKWSARSVKLMYFGSKDNNFSDFYKISGVAKHEFGHALGLGDLYYSPEDELQGVEKGTYWELDSYYISKKNYYSVMCEASGPIGNNEIEMVVLAFRDNEMQCYQKRKKNDKISIALGRGN